MESKVCTMCNIGKRIKDFTKKYTENKICDGIRSSKPYSENEDKTSNQQEIYHEEKDKLLQKENEREIHFKGLVGSCVKLENRIKALEAKQTI